MGKTKELFAQKVMKSRKPESRYLEFPDSPLVVLSKEVIVGDESKVNNLMMEEIKDYLENQLSEKQREYIRGGIGVISASKLTTAWGCSMAFILQYIDKIKVPEPVNMAFGDAIHRRIQILNRAMITGKPNYKSADSFVSQWGPYWHSFVEGKINGVPEIFFRNRDKDVKKYLYLGYHILENIAKEIMNSPKPLIVEEDFKFNFGGFVFRGRMDRVDKTKEGIIITDYKTDYEEPVEVGLHYNYQFSIYDLAFRYEPKLKQHLDNSEIYLELYHLRTGKKFRTERKLHHILQLMHAVQKVDMGIKVGQIYPNAFPSLFHCKYCGYRDPCYKRKAGIKYIPKDDKLEGLLRRVY